MKAVNLIPAESRRGSGVQAGLKFGPGYGLIALLALAVGLVTFYVLTSNTISSRQAKLAALQAQVSQVQAQMQTRNLSSYVSFVKLAQSREVTVRQIVSGRFDWHAALGDLSRVVPSDTSLQSLTGTVAPGAAVSGAGGSVGGAASTGSLRGQIAAPAFELKGCTKTQDDVARLMSRLRLINGVQRVTLADSIKQGSAQAGATVATTGSSAAASTGCGANAPTFDLVVFFQPLPGSATVATPGVPAATGTTPAPAAASSAPATSAAQPVSSSSSSTGSTK
jgi:Tfp pilus assembly protein PilN